MLQPSNNSWENNQQKSLFTKQPSWTCNLYLQHYEICEYLCSSCAARNDVEWSSSSTPPVLAWWPINSFLGGWVTRKSNCYLWSKVYVLGRKKEPTKPTSDRVDSSHKSLNNAEPVIYYLQACIYKHETNIVTFCFWWNTLVTVDRRKAGR